ncbi:hypothetical protein LCGC14_3068780 [marine sediment metagenome]|uniref:DUF3307 domain-containing protein n=1 Tax=marine sediment metagenome TaxID=412755 RepID=A0A0F8YPD8_9ZZZZ
MLWLFFAHFIGDWAFQSDWIAQNKGKYWFVMFAHCAIWTGCICVFYAAFVRNDGPWETIGMRMDTWKIVFLFVGHYVCDLWKCRVYAAIPFCQQKTYWHMYVDQLWHLFQCSIVFRF